MRLFFFLLAFAITAPNGNAYANSRAHGRRVRRVVPRNGRSGRPQTRALKRKDKNPLEGRFRPEKKTAAKVTAPATPTSRSRTRKNLTTKQVLRKTADARKSVLRKAMFGAVTDTVKHALALGEPEGEVDYIRNPSGLILDKMDLDTGPQGKPILEDHIAQWKFDKFKLIFDSGPVKGLGNHPIFSQIARVSVEAVKQPGKRLSKTTKSRLNRNYLIEIQDGIPTFVTPPSKRSKARELMSAVDRKLRLKAITKQILLTAGTKGLNAVLIGALSLKVNPLVTFLSALTLIKTYYDVVEKSRASQNKALSEVATFISTRFQMTGEYPHLTTVWNLYQQKITDVNATKANVPIDPLPFTEFLKALSPLLAGSKAT